VLILSGFCLSSTSGELDITVQLHKKKLLMGEPLFITTNVRNTGDSAVTFQLKGGAYYHNERTLGKIIITGKRFYPDLKPDVEPEIAELHKYTAFSTLKPGDSFNERFVLLFDWESEEFIFNKSKQYRLKVEYFIPKEGYGSSYSEVKKVEVVKPDSQINREVGEMLLRDHLFEYVRFIHVPWQLNSSLSIREEEIEIFQKLINGYERSTYTPYLTFSLARYYRTLSVSDAKNAKKYHTEAEKLFNKTQKLTENQVFEQFIQYEMDQLHSNEKPKDDLWVGASVEERLAALRQRVSELHLPANIEEQLRKRVIRITNTFKNRNDRFSSDAERINEVEQQLTAFVEHLNEMQGKRISDDIYMKLRIPAGTIKNILPRYEK